MPYHPDTVILGFYLDNISEADGKLVNQALARPAEEPANTIQQNNEPAAGPVLRLKRYLKLHSALYRWGQEQLTTNRILVKILASAGLREPLGGVESLDISLLPSLMHAPASIVPLLALAKAKLLELHRLLTEQGIRFIIVLIPSETSIDRRAFDQAIALTQFDRNDFDLDQPYRLLEEFAKTNKIELINPTNVFRQIHSADDSLYLVHDKHFSPKGHQVLAQEIYRYLTKTHHTQQVRQGNRQQENSADNGLLKHSGATGPGTKWPQAGTYEIGNGCHSRAFGTIPPTCPFCDSHQLRPLSSSPDCRAVLLLCSLSKVSVARNNPMVHRFKSSAKQPHLGGPRVFPPQETRRTVYKCGLPRSTPHWEVRSKQEIPAEAPRSHRW